MQALTETRARLRAYFESLTPDSRPCTIWACPMVVAGVAVSPGAATTLDPLFVGQVDLRARVGAQLAGKASGFASFCWPYLTAADVLGVLDSIESL